MKENKKKLLFMLLFMVIIFCVLLAVNYLAVIYCIGNRNLFVVMVLVVPTVIIAIAAFIMGSHIKWNWKRGLCLALMLTLISFGTGQLMVFMADSRLDNVVTDGQQSTLKNNSEDEFMNELYDELDKKAYEYMLEQGLISEGEKIYSDDSTINARTYSGNEEEDNTSNDGEIVSSEMYIGIQKSDQTTEMIGNLLTFLIAFGLSFLGSKVKNLYLEGNRNSH